MFNKIKSSYGMIAIIVLNLIILFVVIEVGSVIIRQAYGFLKPYIENKQPYEYHPLGNLSYYQQQEWGLDYWKEHRLSWDWVNRPYVEWQRKPYSGRLINIDESGLRITSQL